ncbi:MAG: flagellar basal body-associated FliL family protein [Actinobacteria bacterium]|nr:flagellar basal body-associated FliL family protein [Actinomycetota bacterium]
MAVEQAVSEAKEVSQLEVVPEPQKAGLLSKLGGLKIPIIILAVILLAVGTALVITKAVGGESKEKEASEKKTKKEVVIGKFITLDAFTVNLAGGQNYLQTVIALELDGKNVELEKEVKERKPQINDAVLTILSEKSIDAIADNQGREKLKEEIKKSVDSLLGYGKIERVYFTTFIMQ